MAALCVIIVLGLAILLWGAWHGYTIGSFGIGHAVANMYFIPAGLWNGFPSGTCGPDTIPMTSTSMIEPSFENSFLNSFGEPDPSPGPGIPPMINYSQKKDVIDTLMAQAQVNGTGDSVIGFYEYLDSRLLLMSAGENVTELVDTANGIRTFTLLPRPVGVLHTGPDEGGTVQHGAYIPSREHTVTILRIDPVLPHPGNETVPLYIVKKTLTDTYRYPDGTWIATISTNGTFYVLYGQRVERIVAGSTFSLDPSWNVCSQKIEISGEGSKTGALKHTVKLAHASERMLLAYQITTGEQIQVTDGDMGSTSQWISRDSIGCSC